MARKKREAKAEPDGLGSRVSALIQQRIAPLVHDKTAAEQLRDAAAETLPPEIVGHVDYLIASRRALSYRDGIIIQAAYGLVQAGGDLCQRHDGARGVAQRLGSLLLNNHVPAKPDVYQNIAKNSENLCRNNVPQFDAVLKWATSEKQISLQALLDYTCARVILLARHVLPKPEFDVPRLTFYRVAALLDEMLSRPSAGAHEQFAVAAFLEALVAEFGVGGLAGLRVETKNLNASDASAGSTGDVEVRHGGRLIETFEITANDWRTKLEQTGRVIRSADLKRIHVLATVRETTVRDMSELGDLDADVSVVDVRQFLRALLGILSKTARRDALARLYELLDRKQPDYYLVNEYVELIKRHGLAA